jgi:hypothetical protein
MLATDTETTATTYCPSKSQSHRQWMDILVRTALKRKASNDLLLLYRFIYQYPVYASLLFQLGPLINDVPVQKLLEYKLWDEVVAVWPCTATSLVLQYRYEYASTEHLSQSGIRTHTQYDRPIKYRSRFHNRISSLERIKSR